MRKSKMLQEQERKQKKKCLEIFWNGITKHIRRKRKGRTMEFKELLEKSNMNMKQFSEYFEIPYRTVQDWKNGARKCPLYLMKLIAYKLEKEE